MNENDKLTEEEINSLQIYTSRRQSLDDLVGCKDYEQVNRFLRHIIENHNPSKLPCLLKDVNKFKDFLKHIENIFSAACKYGKNHELPPTIFRAQDSGSNIISNGKRNAEGDTYWEADQFLSCSKSEGEARNFASLAILYLDIDDAYIDSHQIPFIDVDKVLGEDQMYSESEIILPPFLDIKVKGKETTRQCVYYDLEVEPFFAKQTLREELYELTDEDIEKYIELANDYYHNENYGNKKEVLEYQWRIKTYLHSRLKDLHYEIMMNHSNELDSMFEDEKESSKKQEEQNKNRYY